MRYNPFDEHIHLDPYPTYAEMRRDAPVYRADDGKFWALSRFEDIWNAVRDPETYSSAQGIFIGDEPTQGGGEAALPVLITMDPPRHDKLRAVVSRAFTPRRIVEMEPTVRALTDKLLETALDQDSFDLVETISGPLPTFVIADMLGIPRSDYDDFRKWSEQMVAVGETAADGAALRQAGITSLFGYFSEIIAEHRRSPRPDLVTALIEAEVDGERLSDQELLSFCLLLLVAGNETTTNLISNTVVALINNPDQQKILRENGLGNAVEEFLRFDSPIQGLARTLTRDVALHGETMHEGEKVMLLFGAANHDAAEFGPDAGKLNVQRDIRRHLAFGHGVHFCLGSNLARMEGRIACEALLAAIPHFELTGKTRRLRSGPMRGFVQVPIRSR